MIYLEVPNTTTECKVGVPIGENDLIIFNLGFFDSKYLKLRAVIICGDCGKDGAIKRQSFTSPMNEHCSNEFSFEFEMDDSNKLIVFELYVDDVTRCIGVEVKDFGVG